MGRYFKVTKGDLRMIDNFITIGACVKCPYRTKSCCYWKDVSIKNYVLKDSQSIYGISFLSVWQYMQPDILAQVIFINYHLFFSIGRILEKIRAINGAWWEISDGISQKKKPESKKISAKNWNVKILARPRPTWLLAHWYHHVRN